VNAIWIAGNESTLDGSPGRVLGPAGRVQREARVIAKGDDMEEAIGGGEIGADLGVAGQHLDNLVRLGAALDAADVPELARRLRRTPAAIYPWLKKLGLSPKEVGNAAAIARVMERERRALAPHLPWIRTLLDG
jgi:hypothetical protein